MFRPAIQKTSVLAGMALCNLVLFTWVSSSTVEIRSRGFLVKQEAAGLMAAAMDSLKTHRLAQGFFEDDVNDPNETGLVGTAYSLVTTDEGDLDAKLTTLNPNFAALMVDLFLEAGIAPGDTIAGIFTGSMPGGNLATYIAAEVMDVTLVSIVSAGASQWGANQPDFSWLDMETFLHKRGFIKNRAMAASYGGRGDTGRMLSPKGRAIIRENIERNGLPLIHHPKLSDNIRHRMELFAGVTGGIHHYRALVNVGGGAAALGPAINTRLIDAGVVDPLTITSITSEGVLYEFANAGVPIVHILNIRELAEKYDLPFAPIPLPEPGEGTLFAKERYSLLATSIALILSLGVVLLIGGLTHRQIKMNVFNNEPESII